MKINILVDFTENEIDRNRPHIVIGAINETVAAMAIKEEYEENGCIVQSMIVVDGDYTLDQLHDMANYGIGMEKAQCRMLYLSPETKKFFRKIQHDPETARKLREEIKRRKSLKKQ